LYNENKIILPGVSLLMFDVDCLLATYSLKPWEEQKTFYFVFIFISFFCFLVICVYNISEEDLDRVSLTECGLQSATQELTAIPSFLTFLENLRY